MPGLCAGTRILSSRLMDVQSSINWVRTSGAALCRMWDVGCTCATIFRRSGNILSRTSAKALHSTRICGIVSAGAQHRGQAGLRLG